MSHSQWNVNKRLFDICLNFLKIDVLEDFFAVQLLSPKEMLLRWKFDVPFDLAAFEIKYNLLIRLLGYLYNVLHQNYTYRSENIALNGKEAVNPG